MTKEEFLKEGGLDFLVRKVSLHTYNTQFADDYALTKFFATVNDSTGEALGPVRSAYTVKQNSEILDILLDKIGKDNYDLEGSSCGHFDKGRKLYMFIKYTKMKANWAQEDADCYVYALSSHDGSQKLTFGVANKIHSCSNMFSVLMADKERNHTMKHFAGSSTKMDTSLTDLIDKNLNGLASLMRTMQCHKIEYSDSFVSDVMDLVANTNLKQKNVKWHKKRQHIEHCMQDEFSTKGATFYGLFNGMTNYLTHKAGYDTASNLAGTGSKVGRKALQMIIKEMRNRGCLN